ncbi:MAG: hypothetical protein KJ621_08490 [Proteobacteria bacterium]|nr:hypothetical protein [Pseudomonadota bacterium]MBU1742070.1 hypothetical protein [Pseudomonadota bacterium]
MSPKRWKGNRRRRFLCRQYDQCLDQAIARGWPGFSCMKCGDFKPMQKDPADWIEDNLLCIGLLFALMGEPETKEKAA